jgi:hypothetical protein
LAIIIVPINAIAAYISAMSMNCGLSMMKPTTIKSTIAFVPITLAATMRLKVPGPKIALYEHTNIVQAIIIPVATKGAIMAFGVVKS